MQAGPSTNGRIDSWKGIAAYLGRDIRTAIRWEKERDLPVHRVPGGKRHAVYAFPHEIDAWLKNGESKPEEPAHAYHADQPEPSPVVVPVVPAYTDRPKVRKGIHWAAAALALIAIFGMTAFAVHSFTAPLHMELIDFTPLTSDATQKIGLVAGGGKVYFGEVKDGRNIVSSVSVEDGQVRLVPTPLANAKPESISPDGKELLVLAWEGMEQERELWIVPVPTGKPRRVGTLLCHAAAWSPDGGTIAYTFGDSIYVTKDQGSTTQKLQSFAGSPQTLWWFPDGRSLRLEVQDPSTDHVAIWDLLLTARGETDVASLTPLDVSFKYCCESLAMLDDSGRAFVSGWGLLPNSIALLDRRTSLSGSRFSQVKLNDVPGLSGNLALDREHHKLFALSQTSNIREMLRFDPRSSSFMPFLPGVEASEIDYSPDGQWLAYTRVADQSLWVSRSDGSDPREIVSKADKLELPRWSPDGRQIAFMAQMNGKAWRVYTIPATGGPIREALVGSDQQGAPTWSLDGKWLAYGSVECQESETCAIHRINLATGQDFVIPGSNGLATARWSPDGRYIAALRPEQQQVWIFDLAAQQWQKLADRVNGNDLSWSRDSRYLYASRPTGDRPAILRVSIADHSVETAADLSPFSKLSGQVVTWFALAPDGSIIFTHELSTWELYSMRYEER